METKTTQKKTKPRRPHAIYFDQPSLTQTQWTDICDINKIMEDVKQTGRLRVNPVAANYGDFSEVGTYREAVEQIRKSEDQFMQLPAELREHFKNDPENLVNYLQDPQNTEKAQDLGLVNKPEKSPQNAPMDVRVIQDGRKEDKKPQVE